MSDMADVLEQHGIWGYNGSEIACQCNHRNWISGAGYAAHQAAALSAAGFGPVREAKREAWDHGHHDGAVDAMLHMENDGAKTTPNPYREDT